MRGEVALVSSDLRQCWHHRISRCRLRVASVLDLWFSLWPNQPCKTKTKVQEKFLKWISLRKAHLDVKDARLMLIHTLPGYKKDEKLSATFACLRMMCQQITSAQSMSLERDLIGTIVLNSCMELMRSKHLQFLAFARLWIQLTFLC